jgi:hypothetical protein
MRAELLLGVLPTQSLSTLFDSGMRILCCKHSLAEVGKAKNAVDALTLAIKDSQVGRGSPLL